MERICFEEKTAFQLCEFSLANWVCKDIATTIAPFRLRFLLLANALTIVLVAAMALSFGVQDFIEGAVIAAVIVLNTT